MEKIHEIMYRNRNFIKRCPTSSLAIFNENIYKKRHNIEYVEDILKNDIEYQMSDNKSHRLMKFFKEEIMNYKNRDKIYCLQYTKELDETKTFMFIFTEENKKRRTVIYYNNKLEKISNTVTLFSHGSILKAIAEMYLYKPISMDNVVRI